MNVPAPIAGGVFLLLSLVVLELPGMTRPRDDAAAAASRRWRRLAFDSWACGVLSAALSFVFALGRSGRGLEATAREMALSFLPALLGLAIAAVAGMRALAIAAVAGETRDHLTPSRGVRLSSSAVFVLLVAGALLAATSEGGEARLSPLTVLLHPPALLTLAGLSVLLRRVAGRGAFRWGPAPAIGLAGLLSGLVGLLLALAGFAGRDLVRVTSGLHFLLTSGTSALVALLLLAREEPGGQARGPGGSVASAVAWALLPLAVLVFLVFAFLAVLMPMTAPG